MRLLITVLLLVVLPTALLSVIAGRSLQARELMLTRRLSQEAVLHLDAVAARMDQRRTEALADITRMFRDAVLSGRDGKRFDDVRQGKGWPPEIVVQPFLFLNPWGFLYPETSPATEPPDAVTADALRLQPALTRALADGTSRIRGRIMLVSDGRLFCFAAVPDYSDLYAGMELSIPGLMRVLDRLLAAESGPFMRLSVLSAASLEQGVADAEEDVVVSDSLGARPEPVLASLPALHRRDGILAVRCLHAPLAHIEIGATAANATDLRRAYRLQERLTIWGILLLAVVISSSALILIAGALRQASLARLRSEFVAGMSHDLRTPVAAMRVLAESLLGGRVVEEARRREFLAAIVSECDRLGDLIERVMFYFRQEQGALKYEKTLVEVDVLAAGIAERFRRQHAGRVRILVTAQERIPPVRADVNALEKALTNLMDNAVKYGRPAAGTDKPAGSGPEGVPIAVGTETRRWRGRHWVVVTVRDWGEGLADGEQRRIFSRFYRGTSVAHAHRGGFGLGLSLVADIVKAHRGRILACNAPGGGAVFELWLRTKGGNHA